MHAGMKNILITGYPGVGKTTFVRALAEKLNDGHTVGFVTTEIRHGGVRTGFALESMDGSSGVLSHVDFRTAVRVGRFGVDIEGFEAFLKGIDFFGLGTTLVIIDEIGKMECRSGMFTRLVRDLLDSDKRLVATIARTGGGLISEVRRRGDIVLVEITAHNRDTLLNEVLKMMAPGQAP